MNVNEEVVEAEDLNPDQKQDFVFQFVCADTGHRSEPFSTNWDQLKGILDARTEKLPKPTDEDYILLIAVMDKQQTHIPTTPLIKVKTFLEIQPEK